MIVAASGIRILSECRGLRISTMVLTAETMKTGPINAIMLIDV